MGYDRPWLSFEEQLAKIKARGLIVTNDTAALDYLERLGYYRLSAYWYSFRKVQVKKDPETNRNIRWRSDEFLDNASLEMAAELYVFDKRLRMLALDAVERIEIAVRVDIAYLLGKRDKFAYLHPDLLDGKFSTEVDTKEGIPRYEAWLNKFNGIVEASKEAFVQHHKAKYGLPLPIWVAIELWDFGLLSKFFNGMAFKDQREIAEKYGLADAHTLVTWMRSINHMRNICAHHGRLWNRSLVDQPKLPRPGSIPDFDRFRGDNQRIACAFMSFCLLQWMMKRICPASTWTQRFKNLVATFPVKNVDKVSLADMGCIEGWENWKLWNPDPQNRRPTLDPFLGQRRRPC